MKAVIKTGQFKSVSFGQIVDIEKMSATMVRFVGVDRIFEPSVAAYIDDEGHPLTIREAACYWKKQRKI